MPVTTPQLQSYRRARSAPPTEHTLLILAVAAVAFGVAHAVEGVVGIARDILRTDPAAPGAEPAGAPASPAKAVQHEAAGFFLIVAVACVVKLMHRMVSDLREVLRDIGGDGSGRHTVQAQLRRG
jgi:hypothetical protein